MKSWLKSQMQQIFMDEGSILIWGPRPEYTHVHDGGNMQRTL
jgi:hypothetical protein